MRLSNKYRQIILKYKDEDYFARVPKYIITYDLQSIGIDIKPCYDIDVLKGIIKVLLERI